MWWSKFAPLLLVAACGYAPALAPGGSASTLIGQVAVEAPKDANAFDLVRELENRLGRGDTGALQLDYDITTDEVAVGVTAEQETTRYSVRGAVAYRLTDPATGKPVFSGTVQNSTGYSTTATAVSTRAAQQDAYERLMVILADEIVERLIRSGMFAG